MFNNRPLISVVPSAGFLFDFILHISLFLSPTPLLVSICTYVMENRMLWKLPFIASDFCPASKSTNSHTFIPIRKQRRRLMLAILLEEDQKICGLLIQLWRS